MKRSEEMREKRREEKRREEKRRNERDGKGWIEKIEEERNWDLL